jgi:hypothetical protein
MAIIVYYYILIGNIQVCQPEGEVVFPRACPRENNPSRVDKSGCFPTPVHTCKPGDNITK